MSSAKGAIAIDCHLVEKVCSVRALCDMFCSVFSREVGARKNGELTLASKCTFKKTIQTSNWFPIPKSTFVSLCLHSFHPRFSLSRQLKYKKQLMQEKSERKKKTAKGERTNVGNTLAVSFLTGRIWTVRGFLINVKSQGYFYVENVDEKASHRNFTCTSYTRATENTIV